MAAGISSKADLVFFTSTNSQDTNLPPSGFMLHINQSSVNKTYFLIILIHKSKKFLRKSYNNPVNIIFSTVLIVKIWQSHSTLKYVTLLLVGEVSTPVRTKPMSTGRLAPVPDALTAVPAKEKNRSESSPRLQKTLTCACGLHAFCSPRLYAFSSLHSAGHCTEQS